jgi:integrase/recombinase XerC
MEKQDYAQSALKELKAFADYLCETKSSALTVRSYLADMKQFAIWFEQSNGESLSPKRLTSRDASEYRAFLIRQKYKPKTVNRHLVSLIEYSRWAQHKKLISDNPLAYVKMMEEEELQPRWLTKQEEHRLLREAEATLRSAKTDPARRRALRDFAILLLLLNTALRVSELCDLEIDDLVLSERMLWVTVRAGKGGKRREVPVKNKQVLDVVKQWLAERPEVKEEVIFIGRDLKPLRPSGVQDSIKELARRAGVEAVTPHTFRHTFAKRLSDAGVPETQIIKLTGHKSKDTLTIYTTPTKHDLELAVERLA